MHQSLHQLFERLFEFFDSFVFKLPGRIFDAETQFRQSRQNPSGFLDILFEPGFRLSAVAVGGKGFGRGAVLIVFGPMQAPCFNPSAEA